MLKLNANNIDDLTLFVSAIGEIEEIKVLKEKLFKKVVESNNTLTTENINSPDNNKYFTLEIKFPDLESLEDFKQWFLSFNFLVERLKKVLFVHPIDETTKMFSTIYNKIYYQNEFLPTILNYRFVDRTTNRNDECSIEMLNFYIEYNEQTIFIGHGDSSGLINPSNQETNLINKKDIELLKKANNNFYLWCDSIKFVKEHNLSGLCLGRFISQMSEAEYFGVKCTEQDIIESNDLFCLLIKSKKYELFKTFKNLKELYKSDTNPIITFNRNVIKLHIKKLTLNLDNEF